MSCYIPDRDLLPSLRNPNHKHTHYWIDVHSNRCLIGQNARNDSETLKTIADMQDQLKMLRTSIDKKDSLIAQLSSYKKIEKFRGSETAKLKIKYVESSSTENAKKETAEYHAKYVAVSTELSEAKIIIQGKDEKISELKRDIEKLKSENASLNSLAVSLREKIKELEGNLGSFETAANKSGITIEVLQKENKDYQQKILDLESRIRSHLHEREEAERKTNIIHKKLDELVVKVTSFFGIQISTSADGMDLLISKITDIINENSILKSKYMTTTEKLVVSEAEAKLNRDTIQRLFNEINKFEKDSVLNKLLVYSLKEERDCALTTKSVLEKEIDTLKLILSTHCLHRCTDI